MHNTWYNIAAFYSSKMRLKNQSRILPWVVIFRTKKKKKNHVIAIAYIDTVPWEFQPCAKQSSQASFLEHVLLSKSGLSNQP